MQAVWSIKCIYLPLLQAGIEIMHPPLMEVHEQSCVVRESVAPCEMWSCLLSAIQPSHEPLGKSFILPLLLCTETLVLLLQNMYSFGEAIGFQMLLKHLHAYKNSF